MISAGISKKRGRRKGGAERPQAKKKKKYTNSTRASSIRRNLGGIGRGYKAGVATTASSQHHRTIIRESERGESNEIHLETVDCYGFYGGKRRGKH